VVVVEFVVDDPPPALFGCVTVVCREVDVVDHGCQAKAAIPTATINIKIIANTAAFPPPLSRTITGP
jgi:hypothetical protein